VGGVEILLVGPLVALVLAGVDRDKITLMVALEQTVLEAEAVEAAIQTELIVEELVVQE
jgi:ketopantoate hydroxymethyltransferase